jgi:hypothetical protein
MTYKPWTNGVAVGFECTGADGSVGYVYLNPSTSDSDGLPNIFLYKGTHGDPAFDGVVTWTGSTNVAMCEMPECDQFAQPDSCYCRDCDFETDQALIDLGEVAE